MRMRQTLLSAAGLGLAGTLAHAYETPIVDIDAVMECRGFAIAHARVADIDVALFSEASAQALREQADFAMILGVWGAPLTSVEKSVA